VGDVVDDLFEASPTVAGRIFDLLAGICRRLDDPRHRPRCEVPLRCSRHAREFEVAILMARRAFQRRDSLVGRSAHDRRIMNAAVVPLKRRVARRMAVAATRVKQDLRRLDEQRASSLVTIRDR